ncbi:NTP transferase domain-containing protein [bacterium]|nr:NTP transferase domain-containing protein [bacterium]
MRPTLVVLAAGVGSRYGGLKQLDLVGPGGATLMDYTIFDAVRAGFSRVVIVVSRETEAEIREHMDGGAARRTEILYACQELEALPEGYTRPEDREKPWGTGQAVLMAAPLLDGPFVVANADDYYGREGIAALGDFLAEPTPISGPVQWAMVGYCLADTLPASGSVSRALCLQDKGGWLTGLQEILAIQRNGGVARWEDAGGVGHITPLNALVSMNLWGFTPDLLGYLEDAFKDFLAAGPGPKDEFYLPVAVAEAVRAGTAKVKVLPEGGRWCGMTSREDRETTTAVLRELVGQGVYPDKLWE